MLFVIFCCSILFILIKSRDVRYFNHIRCLRFFLCGSLNSSLSFDYRFTAFSILLRLFFFFFFATFILFSAIVFFYYCFKYPFINQNEQLKQIFDVIFRDIQPFQIIWNGSFFDIEFGVV